MTRMFCRLPAPVPMVEISTRPSVSSVAVCEALSDQFGLHLLRPPVQPAGVVLRRHTLAGAGSKRRRVEERRQKHQPKRGPQASPRAIDEGLRDVRTPRYLDGVSKREPQIRPRVRRHDRKRIGGTSHERRDPSLPRHFTPKRSHNAPHVPMILCGMTNITAASRQP